jgi:hypothetical protein
LGEVLVVGGICLFGENADIKNDCEDTADNIGDNAPFFLVKIRASVIVLKYNPIILWTKCFINC